MDTKITLAALIAPAALALASCNSETTGDGGAEAVSTPAPSTTETVGPFAVSEHGSFDEPWAAAFEPGTGNLFITEKAGTVKFYQTANGRLGFVSGVPEVDYGGQGGLGDIAFAPDYAGSKAIYLTWAEAGDGNTRGAALGRGTLVCEDHDSCDIRDLRVIWRQDKTTGRGHYSHRIAFSPDGQYLYLASGERQKMQPAQDLSNNLGTIVRLNLDGTPASGNPLSANPQVWSYGHRNILGLEFDAQGQLWDVEHGPRGGDELNLVKSGANYGWPVVSNGIHYDGGAIPDHSTRPEFAAPAESWVPVIAPGDMTFYRGAMFADWRGDAIIAAMKPAGLVRVSISGEAASEAQRIPFDNRIRAVVEASDGALWVLEDGDDGRLLRLTPAN